uniref:DUF4209 domain-containing protein n=1 Tax=Timema monikensis TaxID=170555 RepID=A0A7R9EH61_9NEOP|nr:unnamed protein product [Timema monikensis]
MEFSRQPLILPPGSTSLALMLLSAVRISSHPTETSGTFSAYVLIASSSEKKEELGRTDQPSHLSSRSRMATDIGQKNHIVFMQVLIGTPLGMNLRNIVWHGFPRPEEIKDHFVTTLLITVASIGELLETQGVDICQLPNRTPVVNLPECAEVLAGCFPNIHDYQEQVLELNQPHSTTWDAILQHYIERRFVLEQGYIQARIVLEQGYIKGACRIFLHRGQTGEYGIPPIKERSIGSEKRVDEILASPPLTGRSPRTEKVIQKQFLVPSLPDRLRYLPLPDNTRSIEHMVSLHM